MLELVGLTEHQDKQPSQLSGGQQQRAAIARALFIEPAVLLADEPTGNLDLASGAEVLDLFLEAQQAYGQTVVMVTHDPRSAGYADEVLLLRDGQVRGSLDVTARCRGAARTDRTTMAAPRPCSAGSKTSTPPVPRPRGAASAPTPDEVAHRALHPWRPPPSRALRAHRSRHRARRRCPLRRADHEQRDDRGARRRHLRCAGETDVIAGPVGSYDAYDHLTVDESLPDGVETTLGVTAIRNRNQ